jgi:hypothetical protein
MQKKKTNKQTKSCPSLYIYTVTKTIIFIYLNLISPTINIIAKRSLLYANIIRIPTLKFEKIILIEVFLTCS